MSSIDRRKFLMAAGVTAATLPPAIARALSIDADVRTGTIRDVEHVVILTQENRSFDHYFGSMAGVRGFADRFPIPTKDGRTVWTQANGPGAGRPPLIAPFHLNTAQTFAHMRVEGTPHNWADAQAAWDEGRIADWPRAKGEHAMGYYRAQDIPFQFALAQAFTVCDAYHCSIQAGTNSNRLFLWTGTNDPSGGSGGPSITNSHDRFVEIGGAKEPYRWTTYVERLQAAGISWRIYQDMADNFTDNPVVGFQAFRDSWRKVPGSDPRLAAEGLTTHKLDRLRADVLAGTLPAVSYVVAGARDCEHPGPSSPAQGADYTARVIEALTADPRVWSKTVLFLNFDENDGFFDHLPPPAPPSKDASGAMAGGSTVDTAGEYHLVSNPTEASGERPELMGRPYGLGPRTPMIVISPWSRGGWVDSEVFDHTSVIRFLEARFGVAEPNISPWRRAVCGDLTSAFDFKTPNRKAFAAGLPETAEIAARAAALKKTTRPPTPALPAAPEQARGTRPSRALGYALDVEAAVGPEGIGLTFRNSGRLGAVFHVYDRRRLDRAPRRYTVEGGKAIAGTWSPEPGGYDLWVLGPNGFHRHFAGDPADAAEVSAAFDPAKGAIRLTLRNPGPRALRLAVASPAYGHAPWRATLKPGGSVSRMVGQGAGAGWYDLSITSPDRPGFLRRLAGRLETGRPSISDPAMGGPALMTRS
ncbi:MAG TPA: phospholipase C, phosphocholine-specific [Phenylobacterium sp.]|nr:phospholipase C, phosphocholine-specific [Phenylobacterium sp.]